MSVEEAAFISPEIINLVPLGTLAKDLAEKEEELFRRFSLYHSSLARSKIITIREPEGYSFRIEARFMGKSAFLVVRKDRKYTPVSLTIESGGYIGVQDERPFIRIYRNRALKINGHLLSAEGDVEDPRDFVKSLLLMELGYGNSHVEDLADDVVVPKFSFDLKPGFLDEDAFFVAYLGEAIEENRMAREYLEGLQKQS